MIMDLVKYSQILYVFQRLIHQDLLMNKMRERVKCYETKTYDNSMYLDKEDCNENSLKGFVCLFLWFFSLVILLSQ